AHPFLPCSRARVPCSFVFDLAPQTSHHPYPLFLPLSSTSHRKPLAAHFPLFSTSWRNLLRQPLARQNAWHQPRGHTCGLAQAYLATPTGLVSSCLSLASRIRVSCSLV
ncbi:hypothetical protein BC827DRAFT_1344089, partial [Russula dissimulans]